MAVQFACPVCGAPVTADPTRAGRIVPCAGCGRPIQMPAARTPAPQARGSLLWLWVLIGCGFLGVIIGAGTMFLLRERPAGEPAPVAEKPPLAPKVLPVAKEAPKLTSPKTESSKTESPKAELPKAELPKAELPKAEPLKKLPAGALAIPGLRFYLPCDKIEDGAVTEAVSGKLVGKSRGVELVDGPRGKAIRVTVAGLGEGRVGLDLAEHADALAVGEGKPFTMAVWARTDQWDNIGGSFIDGNLKDGDRYQAFTIYRYTRGVGFLVQQGRPGGRADPINQLARGTHEMPPTKGWMHLALSRDDRGTVRMTVDGRSAVVADGAFTADVRFTQFAIGWQQGEAFTADYSEFCLFDRVLTEEEIGRLAERKRAAP